MKIVLRFTYIVQNWLKNLSKDVNFLKYYKYYITIIYPLRGIEMI